MVPRAPWGELEYTTVELERPDESLAAIDSPAPPVQWFFENLTEGQVRALFSAAGLPNEQQRQLADQGRWQRATNGWLVLPPTNVVRTLPPAARSRIYAVLRQSPQNASQRQRLQIPVGQFDRWLAGCALPPDKEALFRRLAYREGATMAFSDFEFMAANCTLAERKRLAKAYSRTPALHMKLRLGPQTDLEALLRYWGGGGRGRSMKPFLEGLTRVPGGASVGVSFFFPTFARTRLYTYPDPQIDPASGREDCAWTALNFFNERPDDRFFSEGFVHQTLKTDYVQVNTNWAFGDVVMVLEQTGNPVHLCVYVADEVVFTKNGADAAQPWVLMKIPEMLQHYVAMGPVALTAFRRKSS